MIKSIKAEEYDDKAFLKMPNLHLLSDNEIEKIKVKRVEVKEKYDDKAFLSKPCDDDIYDYFDDDGYAEAALEVSGIDFEFYKD
jgi:ferredoxin-fold anticodon binding domain-containing protein